MRTLRKKRSLRIGLAPGSIVYTGEKQTNTVSMHMIDYDKDTIVEKDISTISQCEAFQKKPTVSWLNINGVHDEALLKEIGKAYSIHHLVLEDILSTHQRPKMEEYENYIYIVLKMLTFDENKKEISSEQVSFVLGENVVISFQEKEGDVFDPIRKRIKTSSGRVRKMSADYLVYTLIDIIIDNYYLILERLGGNLDTLDEGIFSNASEHHLQQIHRIRHDLVHMRKHVLPLRDMFHAFERSDSPLITQQTKHYLRDAYDHTVQIIDSLDVCREMQSSLQDMYMSNQSNKMNQIMQTLTIIATLFIPLTFIAGIYGMNFHHMPELSWKYGYSTVLFVMAMLASTMLVWFRKKKWL